MNEKHARRYAELLIRRGVDLRPGRPRGRAVRVAGGDGGRDEKPGRGGGAGRAGGMERAIRVGPQRTSVPSRGISTSGLQSARHLLGSVSWRRSSSGTVRPELTVGEDAAPVDSPAAVCYRGRARQS